MTNQSTIDKLIEMHMTSMADAGYLHEGDPFRGSVWDDR